MSLHTIDAFPAGAPGTRAFEAIGAAAHDYLRILYRRRWIAASAFLAVVGGMAIYTYTAVPEYQAQVSVLIDTDAPKVIDFKEVLNEESRMGDYYQTQYELLESRALAERTVRALKLWERPEFAAPTEARAVGSVMAHLSIVPTRGTRIVNVRFKSPHPTLAAEIANAHAQQYIEQGLENRFTASKQATDWLDKQLAEERQRVERSESALQMFREQHDALSLKEGQDIVVQKLADLNRSVTRAKTERIEKESRYRELSAVQHDRSALDSVPVILSNPFIQQLKASLATLQREYAQLSETLGERHPTLIEKRTAVETTEKRLDAEVARVVDSVRNEYQSALAQENSLTRALDEQKGQALSLNRRGIEYAALEREAESIRLVYQSLLQRAKETSVSRELPSTNVRIVDLANPPTRPVFPRPVFNMLLSVLLGTLLAVAAAFVVETLDDRMQTPEDLKDQLGLPFLGLVPEARSKDAKRRSLISADRGSAFTEAFRSVRTNVTGTSGAKGRQSIIVTSASQGEGKTLVATNLAVAIAQAHQSVLIIDADMRRPSVHRLFGLDVKPGLSDLLAGTAAMGDSLQTTAVPGLKVLTAGTYTQHAPELLGASMFKELFDILQEHFDWVIVDSPPVLSVTDASVVARQAAGVAFVVGSGMTRLSTAQLAIEELQRAGATVLGTVLNRADLEGHPFYYSSYVRGEYLGAIAGALPAAPSRR